MNKYVKCMGLITLYYLYAIYIHMGFVLANKYVSDPAGLSEQEFYSMLLCGLVLVVGVVDVLVTIFGLYARHVFDTSMKSHLM